MKKNEAIKMFNINTLSKVTGIDYMKIRNNFVGVYSSLTEEEKEKIKAAIQHHKENLFS